MHPATFSQKPRILPHSRRKPHTLAVAPPSTSRNSRSDNPRLACPFPFPFSFRQRFQIRTHRPSTRSSNIFPMLAFPFSSQWLASKTADWTSTRTQFRDLDKTPTQEDTHSHSLLSDNDIGNSLPHSQFTDWK
jgi:hypothetical protein